jgi:hypothetical protein
MSHMMAFAAYIGFGLFLRSGIVTYLGRPGLAVIAFLLACSVMWAIVGCFGETTALWPILDPLFEYPQPIPGRSRRWVKLRFPRVGSFSFSLSAVVCRDVSSAPAQLQRNDQAVRNDAMPTTHIS